MAPDIAACARLLQEGKVCTVTLSVPVQVFISLHTYRFGRKFRATSLTSAKEVLN